MYFICASFLLYSSTLITSIRPLSSNATSSNASIIDDLNEEPVAGLYFRLSQAGIDYVTELASKALPELLVDVVLPPVHETALSISRLKIERFDQPDISAHFIENRGIGANLSLPRVMVSGIFEAGIGWFSQQGKFRAEITNLSLDMAVDVIKNESGFTIVEIPLCNVTTSRVVIVFVGGMSTALNLMRSVIERRIVDEIGSSLCHVAIEAATFIENERENALATTTSAPSPVPIDNNIKDDDDDGNVKTGSSSSFGANLCASEDLSIVESESGGLTVRGEWGVDVSLLMGPYFGVDHVLFGIDGGVLHYGRAAANVSRPRISSTAIGEQMVGFLVSEYIPNTFFSHIFDDDLGAIHEQLSSNDMPAWMRPMMKLACAGCELQLTALLSGKPTMTIDNRGVLLDIQGDVSIVFRRSRNRTTDIVKAHARLDVTVKPFVRHSRVYGDVSLTNVDVLVKEVGLGGMFGNQIEDVLNMVVPKKLWPKIQRRLRFALNRRGIKLPVLCGVELEKLNLSYIDGAIVIDTDFSYNVDHFIAKFKQYMAAQSAQQHPISRRSNNHSMNITDNINDDEGSIDD